MIGPSGISHEPVEQPDPRAMSMVQGWTAQGQWYRGEGTIDDGGIVVPKPPDEDDPDREQGMYYKFEVHRTDPESEARHLGCAYFVLDITHDPFARIALEAYSRACEASYPKLAEDLRWKALQGPIKPKPLRHS